MRDEQQQGRMFTETVNDTDERLNTRIEELLEENIKLSVIILVWLTVLTILMAFHYAF